QKHAVLHSEPPPVREKNTTANCPKKFGDTPRVRFQQGAAPTHSRVAPRRRAPPSASDRVTIADREQAGFAFGGTRAPSSPLYSARSGRTTILNFGYVVLALPSRRGTPTRVSSRRHPGSTTSDDWRALHRRHPGSTTSNDWRARHRRYGESPSARGVLGPR